MPGIVLSSRSAQAVKKYSLDTCLAAFEYHLKGFGARSIAQECVGGLRSTQQADAAINAGREYTVFLTGAETAVSDIRKALHAHLSALALAQSTGRPHSLRVGHQTQHYGYTTLTYEQEVERGAWQTFKKRQPQKHAEFVAARDYALTVGI